MDAQLQQIITDFQRVARPLIHPITIPDPTLAVWALIKELFLLIHTHHSYQTFTMEQRRLLVFHIGQHLIPYLFIHNHNVYNTYHQYFSIFYDSFFQLFYFSP